MFKICISPNENGFTGQILAFSLSKEMEARFELLLTCQIPMEIDRFSDDGLWWVMIECSKPVFHRVKTNLQAKFLAFSSLEEVKTHSELLLTCQIPLETDRFDDDEQWLNVQDLYSAKQKQIYRPKFWPPVLRRGWRHVQNCCWPVRSQWKLTDLVMMDCDGWWLSVWMFETCIPPSENGPTGQSFGLQPPEGGGDAFRIVFDLSGPNEDWRAWWWMEWWVNGDDDA